jgi:mRNA interferase RelE/StbE
MQSPEYSKQAKKALERLDIPTKQRIRTGINKLPAGDVVKFKSYEHLFRLRIGDWRIIFTMIADEIYIEDILPRGDAY